MKPETRYGPNTALNVLHTRWGRRGALVSLLVGTATVVAKSFSWFHFSSADREDYQVIADWQSTPDSEGMIISISPHSTSEDLRRVGKRLHDRFHDVDNVAVMVFDDAAAARQIRKGSRYVDEARFQAALAHQKGMYLKSARRGEDDFTIYKPYPVVDEVIRFSPRERSSKNHRIITMRQHPVKNKWTTPVVLLIALLARSPEVGASPLLSVEETLAALGKGPVLGLAGAPVTIVEFADFQCSFCKKFWADTLPELKESYVKQGQVRVVYRHFAILGKFSEQAAMAADCAGEQEKFWEYHDKLFGNQGGFAFTQSKLQQYAGELGLKAANFKRCLTTEKYRKKVEGETAVAASLGARGTPTFFVNGQLMVGAQPFDVFQTVIEERLGKVTSGKR